jgi:Protein of unknown function (DUF3168)
MSEFADISTKLITAIISRLRSDASLAALISGVYITAPDNQLADYLILRTPRLQNRSVSASKIAAMQLNIDIWTKTNHISKAHNIANIVVDLMDNSFNITPYKILNMRFVEMQCDLRKIGELRQHSLVFSCIAVG